MRLFVCWFRLAFRNFNPRTREGCDIFAVLKLAWIGFQSTHPWRVRQKFQKLIEFLDYFNPRTREGCDLLDTGILTKEELFQSTHPWRVRRARRYNLAHGLPISIHAPVTGATTWLCNSLSRWKISIHAPVKGATISICHFDERGEISIHAPVKGATQSK